MRLHFGLLLSVVGMTAMIGVSGLAQTSATQTSSGADTARRPAFEVASIKPNKSGPTSPQRAGLPPGDRVRMINVPLLVLIQIAYPDMSQIIGGPKWMGTRGTPNFDADRFDVNAKAEAPASSEQLRLMLQTLLAERFKLVVHTETRQVDVYALRLARADGKLGPNLHPAAVDCRALIAAVTNPTPGKHPCGTVGSNLPPWHVRGVPLTQLLILGIDVGRPIVDKTGLTGRFDFDLNWTPRWALNPSFDRSRFPDVDIDGPDILTAVQEQLGLKLAPEKDDQPVLVIDHVEQPTPD
jgi:uncharacterized protein (TIGR03435 family)